MFRPTTWQAKVEAVRPAKTSRNKAGVAGALCRELQAGLNILCFEIGEISQDLLRRQIRGEHFQHIGHANTHATNTWLPSAFGGVAGDAVEQVL
ncbi:MAG: hypothetical protein A2Z01_10845 [Betaproteobacteria bacterium RBG_16_58_11]|nr:MAG: hypothetical protein A2Z01_10845 [Betaproteobacteria bacterium RBG_16_58_11]